MAKVTEILLFCLIKMDRKEQMECEHPTDCSMNRNNLSDKCSHMYNFQCYVHHFKSCVENHIYLVYYTELLAHIYLFFSMKDSNCNFLKILLIVHCQINLNLELILVPL